MQPEASDSNGTFILQISVKKVVTSDIDFDVFFNFQSPVQPPTMESSAVECQRRPIFSELAGCVAKPRPQSHQ